MLLKVSFLLLVVSILQVDGAWQDGAATMSSSSSSSSSSNNNVQFQPLEHNRMVDALHAAHAAAQRGQFAIACSELRYAASVNLSHTGEYATQLLQWLAGLEGGHMGAFELASLRVELFPNNPWALMDLAICNSRMRRYIHAAQALDRGLTIAAQQGGQVLVMLLSEAARVQVMMENHAKARQMLEWLSRIDQGNPAIPQLSRVLEEQESKFAGAWSGWVTEVSTIQALRERPCADLHLAHTADNCVLISMYTPGARYTEAAKRLETSARKCGLNQIDITPVHVGDVGTWRSTVVGKAKFIMSQFEKYRKSLLFVDIDMEFLRFPKELFEGDVDFVSANMWTVPGMQTLAGPMPQPNSLVLAGNVLFLNYTQPVLTLIRKWVALMEHPTFSQLCPDRSFSGMWNHGAREGIRYRWLPITYVGMNPSLGGPFWLQPYDSIGGPDISTVMLHDEGNTLSPGGFAADMQIPLIPMDWLNSIT